LRASARRSVCCGSNAAKTAAVDGAAIDGTQDKWRLALCPRFVAF
jgi:hypothetical protein